MDHVIRDIDPELLRRLRVLAAQRGQTLALLVPIVLEAGLAVVETRDD